MLYRIGFDLSPYIPNSRKKKSMSRLKQPVFYGSINLADSSVINAVKYDPASCVLDIKLQSGKAYRYRHIPTYTFATLVTSKSAGQVYNEEIKRTYYGTKRKATRLRTW